MTVVASSATFDRRGLVWFVGLTLAGIGLADALGIEPLLALVAVSGSVVLAWRAPAPTLALFFFFLLAVDRDMQSMLPDAWKMLPVGGARLRYSDPLLAAMMLTAAVRSYGRIATRSGGFDSAELWTWGFVAALAVYSVLGVPAHGIAAPGEMRTYYGVVLVIAYIYGAVRDDRAAVQCWQAMYWLAVALVGVSIWRGWHLHRLAIGPETRWLTAHSNLALILACVVPLFLPREGWPGRRAWMPWVVASVALVMTLINPHRSVWLAGSLAFLTIFVGGGMSLRRLATATAVAGVAGAVAVLLLVTAGYDVAAFLTERLTPFTSSFYNDGNAAWRFGLWLEAILRVDGARAWVFGLGFGEHFGIVDLAGEVIRTSPHNAFVTIYYHMGLTGLGLMSVWLASVVLRVARLDKTDQPILGPRAATTLMMATLVGSLAFSLAYPLPVFGLVLVVLASIGARRGTPPNGVDPRSWTPDPLEAMRHLRVVPPSASKDARRVD